MCNVVPPNGLPSHTNWCRRQLYGRRPRESNVVVLLMTTLGVNDSIGFSRAFTSREPDGSTSSSIGLLI